MDGRENTYSPWKKTEYAPTGDTDSRSMNGVNVPDVRIRISRDRKRGRIVDYGDVVHLRKMTLDGDDEKRKVGAGYQDCARDRKCE